MQPLSPALRKQLYREGKRLLGAERMAQLRRLGPARRRAFVRRWSALRDRRLGLRRHPALTLHRPVIVTGVGTLLTGRVVAAELPDSLRWTTVLDDGTRLDLHERCARFQEARDRDAGDTTRPGFAIWLPMGDAPGRVIALEARDGRGVVLRARCRTALPVSPGAGVEVVRQLLERALGTGDGRRELFDRAIGPAVHASWASARVHLPPPVAEHVRYNPIERDAPVRTTLVIPVYGRSDLVVHQLTHFALDPAMRDVQILFVLDDPRLEETLRRDAERQQRLIDLPFDVLYLSRNVGFAGANNIGAAHADGQDLLLLNSDVLPAAPGWLGALYASVGGDVTGRLLGARLLYADGSLQHDGMTHERSSAHEGLWLNRHPGKGLPGSLFATHRDAVERQGLTGACLLVSAADYTRLGGFDEDYILGDFEDSDLCLKARHAGMPLLLASEPVLYHLERQSQDLVTGHWKTLLTYYNCWLHTARWDERLSARHVERAA